MYYVYDHFGNQLTKIIRIDKFYHNGKRGIAVNVTDTKLKVVLIGSLIVYVEPKYVTLLYPEHRYTSPTPIDYPLFNPRKRSLLFS